MRGLSSSVSSTCSCWMLTTTTFPSVRMTVVRRAIPANTGGSLMRARHRQPGRSSIGLRNRGRAGHIVDAEPVNSDDSISESPQPRLTRSTRRDRVITATPHVVAGGLDVRTHIAFGVDGTTGTTATVRSSGGATHRLIPRRTRT
jgi:hypothetical protein